MSGKYRMTPGEDDVFHVAQILKRALARCEQGQKEYGIFTPETDPRDLFEEIEQEHLDCIVYHAFQIMRVRRMRETWKATEQFLIGKPIK